MSNPARIRRLSPTVTIVAVLTAVVLGSWCLAPEVHSQASAAALQNAAIMNLVGKLKEQQAQIVANQTKIEAQTALLKEELRQAKIYSGRGGSGHR